jgi:hypothetical protein
VAEPDVVGGDRESSIRSFEDTLVLIDAERSLGCIEDDEHVVPRVGDDRAEPDLRKRGVAVLS